MSQTKIHHQKLTIKNKAGYEGKATAGHNVAIELDGVPVSGCSFLKIELKPAKLARVTMDMIVELDAQLVGQLQEIDFKACPAVSPIDGKRLAIRRLGFIDPAYVITKE